MGLFSAAAGVPEEELHEWSIKNPSEFWDLVWRHFRVIGERGEGPAFASGSDLFEARFFSGSSLNYARNLLRRSDDTPAIISYSEDGLSDQVSWAELHDLVSQLQQSLRALGVTEKDRVAAW